MADGGLLLVVRTPHREVLRATFDTLRVPTETGHVGVLPRAEPSVLVIEPGLALARRGRGTTLIGTAGGLLHVERARVTILSPIAVVGENGTSVIHELEALARTPSAEMELRRRIASLEQGLIAEMRRQAAGPCRPERGT